MAQTAPPSTEAAPSATVDLGPVRVRADQGEGQAVRTEDSGSYGAAAASINRGLTLRETPQSTSVVTRQLMDDRNLDTLEQAIEQTTGASVLQIDSARSNLFFRGFSVDTIQLDGVAVNYASNFASAPDLFAYDRIEVVRGPSGLFQGAGEPAAGINLARKRARTEQQAIFGFGVGSFDYVRGEADLTGPLAAGGKLRARLLGSYENRGFFTDVITSRKPMVYGTVEGDLSPDTTLSVGATYQQVDYIPFAGLPAFADGRQADIPRSRYLGALWNSWVADTFDAFAEIEHHPTDGIQAKLTARRVERDTDALYATPNLAVSPVTGDTRLNAVRLAYKQLDKSVDGFVTVPFTMGGRDQSILIGANYREFTFNQNTGNGTPIVQNIFNPVYNAPPQDVLPTNFFDVTQEQYGIYGRATIKPVSALTLIVGGRVSWFETQTVRTTTGQSLSSSEASAHVTPYAGVVLDLTRQFSVYASYADIFQPQTQADIQGNLLDPRTGRQFEGGIRATMLGGRLNGHAAIYRIEDRNRAIADPTDPLFSIAAGEVRTNGAEVEISGLLADGWNITAGYAYNDSVFTVGANAAQTGTAFRSAVPKHTANLWTRYTLKNGLSLGGGARYSGSFSSRAGSAEFRQGNYVLLSAQLGYQISANVDATVTVNNLLDERYYAYVNSALTGNRFGEPRSVRFTLNTRW